MSTPMPDHSIRIHTQCRTFQIALHMFSTMHANQPTPISAEDVEQHLVKINEVIAEAAAQNNVQLLNGTYSLEGKLYRYEEEDNPGVRIYEFEMGFAGRRFAVNGPCHPDLHRGHFSYDVQNLLGQICCEAHQKKISGLLSGTLTYGDGKYTYQELKNPDLSDAEKSQMLVDRFHGIAEEWAGWRHREYNLTREQMCHGVVHSVLKAFDGSDSRLPAMQLHPIPYNPDPDSWKVYHSPNGVLSDWQFDGKPITPEKSFAEMYANKYDSFRERFSACAKDLFD